MLNIKKTLTKILKVSSGSKTYNTNNGTLIFAWRRCLNVVSVTFTIHTANNWGTGSGNRITCTLDNSVPLSGGVDSGVELNGIFVHISGTTFRAQNNTGGTLSGNNNFNPSMTYVLGGGI